jgi:hypothetical protein
LSSPQGGDGDGFRFWGLNITIAHNTISDTSGRNERHADWMQTFATDGDHESTGATVRDNKINAGIGYEVGIDECSQDRYQGPNPGGAP